MRPKLRAALVGGLLISTAQVVWADVITLDQAVSQSLNGAPAVKADDAAVSAAQAGRRQADVRPSPSVTVEAENFVGTGPYRVLGQAEVTATYSQPIERGGKREARVAYADSDIEVARAQGRVTRLDLAAEVQKSYVDVQIANEVVRISEYRLEIELGIRAEAVRRVRGYKDPLFVETRANARVAQARLALDEARARRGSARAHLASFWGGNAADLAVTDGIMLVPRDNRGLADADTQLADAGVGRARAGVVVQQTQSRPDYVLSGGARYLRGTGDVAIVGGITIPLGAGSRNRGNIERAQAEREQLEYRAEADRLGRLRRLASLRADADAALARANGIMTDVFPMANKTLEQVRWGYNRGGFRFSDVEAAADAILEVQAQWVEAMTRYRDVQAEIDRLTGRFDEAQPLETNP